MSSEVKQHTHFNDSSFGEFGVLDERVDDRRQQQRLLPRQGEDSLRRHCSPVSGTNRQMLERRGDRYVIISLPQRGPGCVVSPPHSTQSFIRANRDHSAARAEPRPAFPSSTSNVVACRQCGLLSFSASLATGFARISAIYEPFL